MNKDDQVSKIHKMIFKKDNIIIITDKVLEAPKIMKIKEKIIMDTQIKDKIEMIDLKDLITSIILKKLIKEMVHLKIIKKEGFKTIDIVVHTAINMIKREDSKIEGVKCQTENMEIITSKKMIIDVLIAKKKGTLQENVKNQKMKTIET